MSLLPKESPSSLLEGAGAPAPPPKKLDEMLVIIPRFPGKQPDLDFLPARYKSARVDLINRKKPYFTFFLLPDLSHLPNMSEAPSSKKGKAVLTRKEGGQEDQRDVCSFWISIPSFTGGDVPKWGWTVPLPPAPCHLLSACLVPLKKDLRSVPGFEDPDSPLEMDFTVECVRQGSQYVWQGKLHHSPTNSRGDWGVSLCPSVSSLHMAFAGKKVLSSHNRLYSWSCSWIFFFFFFKKSKTNNHVKKIN